VLTGHDKCTPTLFLRDGELGCPFSRITTNSWSGGYF
jgi:hypothetical protein